MYKHTHTHTHFLYLSFSLLLLHSLSSSAYLPGSFVSFPRFQNDRFPSTDISDARGELVREFGDPESRNNSKLAPPLFTDIIIMYDSREIFLINWRG